MAVGKGTPPNKGSPLRTRVSCWGAAGAPSLRAGMAVDC